MDRVEQQMVMFLLQRRGQLFPAQGADESNSTSLNAVSFYAPSPLIGAKGCWAEGLSSGKLVSGLQ